VVLLLGPFLSYFTDESLGHDFLFSVAVIIYFVFAFLILLALAEGAAVNIPLYLWFFLAFTIYTILSDVFIKGKPIDLKYLYSNAYLPAAILMIIIESVHFSERYVKLTLCISLGTVLVSVIVILMQQIVNPQFLANPGLIRMWGASGVDMRMPSIYSWLSPVSIGFTFVSLLAVVMDDFLYSGKKKSSYFLLFLGFVYSFITKARWILVNCFLLVFLFWQYQQEKNRFARSLFVVGLSALLFWSSVEVLSSFNVPVANIIEQRYLESRTGGVGTGSSSTRILAFVIFTELFPQHPIFGVGRTGIGSGNVNENPELAAALTGRSSQIHVGYLSLFFYYGIVGGILYLLFVYFLMRRLYMVSKETQRWGAYFAILGFLLANLTLVYLTLYEVGIITSLVYYKYSSQSLSETETTAAS
jgi:O-Antigen ligase